MRREFQSGLGLTLVIVGVLVLIWDAYAYYVDIGFQRDVPPLLSSESLAFYSALTVILGVLALLGGRSRKSRLRGWIPTGPMIKNESKT